MNRRMLVGLLMAAAVTVALGFSTAFTTVGGGDVRPADSANTKLTAQTGTEAESPTATAEPTTTPAPQQATAQPTPPTPSVPPVPTGPPVYLTFDDGPDPVITPQLLDVLAAHNAKATFFVQGSQVQAYPELAKRIVDEGHSLQNHAWNHPRLNLMGEVDIVTSQLLPTNDAITAVGGGAPTCLRAPYGATGPTVFAAAAATGLEVVGWNLNPQDYNDPGAGAIAAQVLANVTAGSIVLLHDAGAGDRQQTVDAVAAILPELSARGMQPAALCVQ